MKSRLIVTLLLFLAASAAPAQETPGHLVLIGGGEKPAPVMRKFIELAGGQAAPIVVIPTASTEADTPQYYLDLFQKDYGCTDVVVLGIKDAADARKPEMVAAAARARGIFFGGGDQARIITALAGSPVLDALSAAHRAGAAVGGTSAGTACQSRVMITGEGDFKSIRSRAVETWDGLGFLPKDVVVDQHFIARQRSNRLMSVILERPELLGVGVDEDTAIWVRPDGTFEVLGDRSVMVIDAKGAAVNRAPRDDGKDLLGVAGMRVHVLLPGQVFDLARRQLVAPAAVERAP